MLDLRLAFATRLAIHLLFLGAFLATGIVTSAPALGVVALLMLGLELPLAVMTRRRTSAPGPSPVQPRGATVEG